MILKISVKKRSLSTRRAAGIRAQVFRLPGSFEFLISLKIIVSQYDVNSEFD